MTYRFSGHSPSDASSYREKNEVEAWQVVDPLITFAANLIDAGACTQADLDAMQARIDEIILNAYRKAIDLEISPRADQKNVGCALEAAMFSNSRVEKLADGQAGGESSARRESARAAARQAEPQRPRRGRPADSEAADDRHSRRAVRSDRRPLLHRSDADRLRRGEPRLGRRVRRLSRPDRGPALSPAVQFADLRRVRSSAPRSATLSKAAGRWWS